MAMSSLCFMVVSALYWKITIWVMHLGAIVELELNSNRRGERSYTRSGNGRGFRFEILISTQLVHNKRQLKFIPLEYSSGECELHTFFMLFWLKR